jgi:epoxyqueuosine reductase
LDLETLVADIRASGRADYIGTAALSKAYEFIRNQGGDFIAELPTCVSIGIVLPSSIVDLLPRRNERAVQVSYRLHAYEIVNQRLDLLTSEIASLLQGAGYKAFPIPAAERVDDKRICAFFSHKLAANLCGFGWIGKSCLLVTPKHGPRVRWSSVLTDAPVPKNEEQLPVRCGKCSKCVDVCPVKAFTGRGFAPEEPREARFSAEKCSRYFEEMPRQGQLKVCGMCLYVCPFGMDSNN